MGSPFVYLMLRLRQHVLTQLFGQEFVGVGEELMPVDEYVDLYVP